MAFPSIRNVAVAAGFLGLSMIIAGTATAVAGARDGGAVGSGIQLTQVEEPAATPAPAASRGAELIPGMPIEVGADPLLTCDEGGGCSAEAETPAPAGAAATDVSAATVGVEAVDPAASATDDAPRERSGERGDNAASERDERKDADRDRDGDSGERDRNDREDERGERGGSDGAGIERGNGSDRASGLARSSSPLHALAGRH